MIKAVQLSKRLQTIARMVSPGNRFADIGTDHGYLPIWLLQNNLVPYAIGMDIRRGPLEHACSNMLAAGVSDRMELRLSDGLDALEEGEADTIVMSGMGGMLIRSILDTGYTKAIRAKELILSPQSDRSILRQYLRRNRFLITDETVLSDAGKFYTVIKAVPGPAPDMDDPDLRYEDRYGPVLLAKRPEAFLKMLSAQYLVNDKIIDQLKAAQKTEQNRKRLDQMHQKQAELQAILRF